MGEAKRRKKLDPKWSQANWKPNMSPKDYRKWALSELGRDSIICFSHFDDTFFDEIPNWVRDKAPLWVEQQKGKIKSDFLLGIMFDELNQGFLSKKSEELSIKYKKSAEIMYFEILKGVIMTAAHFEVNSDEDLESENSPFLISYEELELAQMSFKQQTNPVYQKCTDIGVDLAKYEQIINNSFLPEEIKYAVIELTVKLKDYPSIIDEIIDSIPQFWILSETRQLLKNSEKQD
jgi:hypothetical protein